jgi:hypothetical protein
MMRAFFLSAGVVVVACGAALASGNPAADALRQQVKALRAEEKSAVKAVEAQFDSVIRGDRLTEKQLIAQREAVHNQEKQALALATSVAQRDQIRAQFDPLRKGLSGQVKLDAGQIAQLRAQKKATVQQIRALYKAKIATLETQIHAMGKSSGSSRITGRTRR